MHRARILVLIGILKLCKGVLFVALGFGLLRLLHHDLYSMAMHLIEVLRFDPGNAFITTLLSNISWVTDARLRQLSLFTFAYAALDFIEGLGLTLEKTWAEYTTLIVTAAFLPLEIVKTLHHPTWWKLLLILANAALVGYLITLLTPPQAGQPRKPARSR
jgi:uncharacterized membrane protein (DUF2068 family)